MFHVRALSLWQCVDHPLKDYRNGRRVVLVTCGCER